MGLLSFMGISIIGSPQVLQSCLKLCDALSGNRYFPSVSPLLSSSTWTDQTVKVHSHITLGAKGGRSVGLVSFLSISVVGIAQVLRLVSNAAMVPAAAATSLSAFPLHKVSSSS